MAASDTIKGKGALVLFSGGQDSATCLAHALTHYERVETIGFDYGQRHRIELEARLKVRSAMATRKPEWAGRLGEDVTVDISGYGKLAESALTYERVIEMGQSGLPTSFVPGRNLVFLAMAGAHAWRRGLDVLVGGMCQTDYSGYPDCREDTLKAQERALALGLDMDLTLDTPLMHLTKGETWAMAHRLGGDALITLILEETHTCYLGDRGHRHDWGYGCGTCPACELRAAGWQDWRRGRAS